MCQQHKSKIGLVTSKKQFYGLNGTVETHWSERSWPVDENFRRVHEQHRIYEKRTGIRKRGTDRSCGKAHYLWLSCRIPPLCLSVRLYVCLPSVCICVSALRLSVCLSVSCLYICMSVGSLSSACRPGLSVFLSLCLSFCLSAYLSISLSVRIYVCMSVCLHVVPKIRSWLYTLVSGCNVGALESRVKNRGLGLPVAAEDGQPVGFWF